MMLIQQIVSQAHMIRRSKKIKLRQPLDSVKVKSMDSKPAKKLLQLIKQEVNVKKVVWQKWKKDELKVCLDTKLTASLKKEARAREIIRKIQDLRKKQSLTLNDQIIVALSSWPKEFEKEIKKKTLAKELEKGKRLTIKKIAK
jgi:hypothetical protein